LYPPKFPGDLEDKELKHWRLPSFEDMPEIEIPDVSPRAFKLMMDCLYTDHAEIHAEDLEDVLAVAKKFQVEALRQLCYQWMEEGVSAENACQLYVKSELAAGQKTHFALRFIEANTEDVVNTPGWDDLPEDHLLSVLRSDLLTIDEIDLFKACLRWAVSECKRRGLEATEENRNRCIQPLIPHLRFTLMNLDDLSSVITASGILSNADLLSIYKYAGLEQYNKIKSSSKKSVGVVVGAVLERPDYKPLVKFSTIKRTGPKDKWTLDLTMLSPTVTLSNKNLTARSTGSSHGYTQGTLEFTKGQHYWRVNRDTAQNSWLMIGVSRKQIHNNTSYSQATVWGLASTNQQYLASAVSPMVSNFTTGPLDVMLDCEAGTLTIINLANGQKHMVSNIPKSSPLVPHFCLHANQQVTIRIITPREFGKN